MAPINFGFGRTSRIGKSKKKLSSTEPFLPDDLSSIKAWYDASDETTIVSSGGLVSQWNDKSGNDHHLTQSIESDRPSTNTHNINSKNALYFNNDMLWTTDSILSGNPDLMMISVVKFLSYNSTLDLMFGLGSGQGSTAAISAGSSESFAWRFNNGNEKYAIGVPSTNTNYLISAVRPNGGTYINSSVFFDGTESASIDATNSNYTLNLGAGFSAGAGPAGTGALGSKSYPMNGLIAEIIVIEASDEITRQKVEGYLAHKWNIANNLPSNHPYALGAPAQDGSVLVIPLSLVLNLDASDTSSYSGSGTTWYDLSGNNNNATLNGSPAWSSSYGGKFTLDNTDDWIDVSIETNSASFTFETWFYSDRPETGTDYGYFFQGDQISGSSGSGPGIAVLEGAATTVGGFPLQPGDMYMYTGSAIVPLNYNLPKNSWKHLTFSWDIDNDEVKVYENGVLKSTVSGITSIPEDIERVSFFSTANGSFTGNYLKGDIATVKVYQGVLDIATITDNYNNTKNRFENTSLVLHLDANDTSSYSGSGTTWYDLSGNNNNGTLVNGPVYNDLSGAKSFNFSGLSPSTDSYVNIPHSSSLEFGGTFTVCAWIRPDDINYRRGIFSTRSANAAGSWQFELGWGYNNPTLSSYLAGRLAVTGVGTWVEVAPINTVAIGRWDFVVYTRHAVDDPSGKIYKNGTLLASGASDTNYTILDNTDDKRIAQGTSGTGHIDGRISMVRVYNTQLSEQEILEIYNQTKSTYGY